jgi:hypothetical protein
MSQVAGPYGLVTSRLVGDLPFSGGMHTYPLTAANVTAFYFGDPVGLSAGQPVGLTGSPTPPATYLGAATANNPIGIFYGCSYQDPKWGFVNSQSLPANALALGYSGIMLKIMDWPYLVMQVQANGPVTLNQIGLNAALVGPFGGGNPNIGNSVVALNAGSVGTAVNAVRIYDFLYTPGPSPGASSQPGDPFTDVLVTWCPGVHRFTIGQGL